MLLVACLIIALLAVALAYTYVTVSARSRAQIAALTEDFQRAEQRQRTLIDTALDALVTADETGRITSWNAQATELFGWTREEAIGRALSQVILPSRLAAAHDRETKRMLAVRRRIRRRVEMIAVHKDGYEFPVEIALTTVTTGTSRLLSAFIRDLRERKRVEMVAAVQYATTRVLAVSPSLEDAGPQILGGIREGLGWDLGALWLVDTATDTLRFANGSAAHPIPDWLVKAAPAERGKGLRGRAWEHGFPAWTSDMLEDFYFLYNLQEMFFYWRRPIF